MSEHFIIGLTTIIFSGILAQWISWRFSLPAILLLLIFGFIAGPVTGFLNPDQFFGDLLFPMVSISVAVILFEGGLSLKFKELKEVGGAVRNLIFIGVPITWILSSLGSYYIIGFSLPLSILLGAILVVTGPTVIIPILRTIRPNSRINSALKWEGIINDPIGAMLAILVFEVIVSTGFQDASVQAITGLLKTLFLSGGVGLLAGYILTLLLKYNQVPDFLDIPVVLTVVVLVYTASDLIQAESGLFAVTITGVYLANQKSVVIKSIIEFKENLRLLLISVLFIVLAARLQIEDLNLLTVESFIFVAVLVLVIRPLTVFLATINSELKLGEKIFLSWMAPRGIVAAAVSAIFAIELVREGYQEAEFLVPITFLVIIITIAIYGLSAIPLSKWLKLGNPNPQGLLIVGAYPLARAIARVLKAAGFKVLLVDNNYYNISAARMEGINSYYGNILSEGILDKLELDGLGRLLALTPNREVNSLATVHFTQVFESSDVYQLEIQGSETKERDKLSRELHGGILFGENLGYYELVERFNKDGDVKSTPITEKFSYETFLKKYGEENVLPLFLINEDKTLIIYTKGSKPKPEPGQTVISLISNLEENDGMEKAIQKQDEDPEEHN